MNKAKRFGQHVQKLFNQSVNTHCTTSTQETALIVLVRPFQCIKPLIDD